MKQSLVIDLAQPVVKQLPGRRRQLKRRAIGLVVLLQIRPVAIHFAPLGITRMAAWRGEKTVNLLRDRIEAEARNLAGIVDAVGDAAE